MQWYSKRWLVVVVVFLAVIAMAVVGVYSSSQLAWQASPEKALMDAMNYSSKTPGTYNIKSKDMVASVSYDGERFAAVGTYKSVPYNVVVAGTMLYVKSTAPAKLADMLVVNDSVKNIKPLMDAIAARITDKWVAVSLQDFPQTKDGASNHIACAMTARSFAATNKAAMKDLAAIYDTNRFLAANKTNETDKSHEYDLAIDSNMFGNFMTEFKKSRVHDSLGAECDTVINTIEKLGSKEGNARASVFLSKSKNALQKATIDGSASGAVSVDAHYGDVGVITIPTDAIPYTSITNGVIQTMVQSYLGGAR